METPSSTRRVTRSQTLAVSANSNTNISRKMEDSEKGLSKSSKRRASKQDRSALIDITNDSPIVGLASGNLKTTPISSVNKQRSNRCKRTPGSGEALLRGQVKNLLQKVEEEAEISKFSLESNDRPIRNNLKAFLNSPAGLLAPTPANTPQVLNFSSMVDEFDSLGSVSESPVEDQLNLNISQMVSEIFDGKKQAENGSESEKDLLSRSLFLDFIDKSESSSECSSVVTDQGTGGVQKPAPPEDDDASIWSIQVNASTRDDDEDEDEVIEDEAHDSGDVYDDDEDFGEEGDRLLDDLCEEMSKISVNGEKEEAKFMGKHTRFVYDSDDELVEKHEDCDEMDSTEVLRLKGLPTPKGKHLRFQDEEGDEQ